MGCDVSRIEHTLHEPVNQVHLDWTNNWFSLPDGRITGDGGKCLGQVMSRFRT